MEIIRLLINIMAICPGFLLQTVRVRQTPVIWAEEGSSAILSCDYNVIGENVTVGSYKWYRHMVGSGAEVSENTESYSGRISRVDTGQFLRDRSAAITLHRVEPSDSGMYFCEVSLQSGREISGNGSGTFLNVTAAAPRNRTLRLWLLNVGAAAGGVLLLAALSAAAYCMHTKQASSVRDVAPIVYTDFMEPRSPDVAPGRVPAPQEQPPSLYNMENHHYSDFQGRDHRRTPCIYQETDVYSIIP